MDQTDKAIVQTMRHAEGTNWTPQAIAERMGADRGYVKSQMWRLPADGGLGKVSRGLYTIPTRG